MREERKEATKKEGATGRETRNGYSFTLFNVKRLLHSHDELNMIVTRFVAQVVYISITNEAGEEKKFTEEASEN